MTAPALVTDDGWKVELISLVEGAGQFQTFKLTHDGILRGPMLRKGVSKSSGFYTDISIIQTTMGEAFARLHEEETK